MRLTQVSRNDPLYELTKLHFAEILSSLGSPLILLNLTKSPYKPNKEAEITEEYEQAVSSINE